MFVSRKAMTLYFKIIYQHLGSPAMLRPLYDERAGLDCSLSCMYLHRKTSDISLRRN